MSESQSDEEDPIDNIDFSVISTAIEIGGNTLDQILNAVHYGSPEVRQLLREACDFIFECKHCKNLFRSIPNFVAHKRIYCGEKSFFPQNTTKKKPKKKEEFVTVRPISPSLSIDTNSKDGEKTVLEQILTGTFQGNSDAYKLFSEAATHVEKERINPPSTSVMTSAIGNTQNAVSVHVVEMPEYSESSVTSNASDIIAKAQKSRKQPLTKIVDSLKKTAKATISEASKTVMNISKETPTVSSPKKTDNKTADNLDKEENVTMNVDEKSSSSVASPRKILNKTYTKAECNPLQKSKEKVGNKQSEQNSSSAIKPSKVVLTVLPAKFTSSEDNLSQKSASSSQISVPSSTESSKSQNAKEKTQVPKPSTDLRPVKTHGTELSELSQLGHCDLNKLECLICNLQYSHKKTLLQHMHVIHSGTKKKYPCNMCNKKFDYFWGLTRHILLNHKKTKEEIDKMRPELHALAYTVTSDKIEDREPANKLIEKRGSSSAGKQATLVKMHTCTGCNKSFWKKGNYDEHSKQCRFLSAISTDGKDKAVKTNKTNVKKENTNKQEDKKANIAEVLASRRRRTLEKLRDSREKNNSDRDESSNKGNSENVTNWKDLRGPAASRRLRVDGKFVSKEKEAEMRKEEKKAEEDDEKVQTNKLNAGRNKVVKKLKEKSRTFVPAQRFISTRRSAAFYHSPAQQTRFHDKRRAVVVSPKKDSRSPTKSQTPTKSHSGSSTPTANVSSEKKSPQQKSELEVARRNLLNAIEKVKKDQDHSPEKTLSPAKKETVLKTPVDTKHPNSPLKKVDKEISSKDVNSEPVKSLERMSRPTSRQRDNKTSRDRSEDELKQSSIKSEKNTPSRDSSVDSVRSRKSTRSQRDTSRELSEESFRSRQSTRSLESSLRSYPTTRTTNTDTTIWSSQRQNVSGSIINRRSTSRDSSTENVRNSSKELNAAHKNKNVGPDSQPSRESSCESIRTRSCDSTKHMKSPSEVSINTKQKPPLSESQIVGGTSSKNVSSEPAKNISPQSGIQISPQSSSKGEINDSKNNNKEKIKISPKEKKENLSNKISGNDEIDGGRVDKVKPKWSTKNWRSKRMEKAMEVSESIESLKPEVSKSVQSKGQVSNSKEKLKEVAKPKIVKRKPRYPTRSLKTRLQAAKKIGELKKRYSKRISKMTDETEERESDKKTKLDDTIKGKTGKKTPNTSPSVDNTTKTSETKKCDKSQNKGETSPKSSKTATTMEGTKVKEISCLKLDKREEGVGTTDNIKIPKRAVTYSHRPRNASDMEGVRVIEEIWVKKELGQPLQNVKVKKTIIDSPKKVVIDPPKKTIIDSPKKTKTGRLYVVDSAESDPDKSKCLDFSRINHLVDYKNHKCLQCGMELTDISSLRRHAVRHLGWKRYKCKLCAYTGFNRSECNSHIKRRHAEKLVTSCAPLSTFIIDLNKEASNVRNKKKQSTIRRKNTAKQISDKTKEKTSKGGKPVRKLRKNKVEECKETAEVVDKGEKPESDKSDSVEEIPIPKRTRSNSGPSVVTTSTETDDLEKEDKISMKRKRTASEEGSVSEAKGDNSSGHLMIVSSSQTKEPADSLSESGGNIDDLEEELRSVSDYEDNEDVPQRNVVSPTWTKMNPNVALMMATLEEARATKFARGKKARGGIRRFSSPLKKHPRLSTDDLPEEDPNSSKDDKEEDMQLVTDKDGVAKDEHVPSPEGKDNMKNDDGELQKVEASATENICQVKTEVMTQDSSDVTCSESSMNISETDLIKTKLEQNDPQTLQFEKKVV